MHGKGYVGLRVSAEVKQHADNSGIVDHAAGGFAVVIFWKWRAFSGRRTGTVVLVIEAKGCDDPFGGCGLSSFLVRSHATAICAFIKNRSYLPPAQRSR